MSQDLDEDHEQHHATLGPGMLLGQGEVFFDTYYLHAVALTRVETFRIERAVFLDQFLAVPAIARHILTDFAHIIKGEIKLAALAGSRQRLACYFHVLAGKSGHEAGDWVEIRPGPRHDQIATTLNLSREHVTRTLQDLRREGVVEWGKECTRVDRNWLAASIPDQTLLDSLAHHFSDP